MSYIGNAPITAAFLTDTFSGDGSSTAFTLTIAPASSSSILVAVTGVVQDPSTYSVAGTTLTFSAAPPSGTNNISVRYLGIPASGVTTTAYRTITETTATSGQTTFSVPSYTVGYADVYRNGVRLASTDFTATSGTSVVLTNACSTGDTVVVESFYVSSVLNAIPATAGAVNSTYLASNLSLSSPTLSSPTINGTPSVGASLITSGTAVASTSGTSIDFTSIPSWAKRITVMLSGVSLSTTASNICVRIGSGSFEATGYVAGWGLSNSVPAAGSTAFTTSFGLVGVNAVADTIHGSIILTHMGSNLWAAQGSFFRNGAVNAGFTVGGSKTTSGTLDRVQVVLDSTGAFDAGSINILYE